MASSAVDRLIRLLKPLATASSLALVLALAAGCDKQDKAPGEETGAAERSATDKTGDETSNSEANEPKIVYKDGPEPTSEAVLAQTDDITVRLSDFERAMRQSTLVAPDGQLEAPKDRLANPHLQVNVVRNLLTTEIILGEAKRRGLEASKGEKVAALKSKRGLDAFASILEAEDTESEELEKRGLTLEDLDGIATELVLREKLRDALVAEITEEQLWQAYRQQNDRMRLLLASVRNTPTMEEITALVEEQPERIKEHFEANKKQYRPPAMVKLTMLSPAPIKNPDSEKPDKALLEKAAARLEKGDKPEAIASELGLRLDTNALLVRGENPEAFDAEPGATGFETSGARGAYAWKVQEKRASKDATLTKALEREIAAELLRNGTVVASKASRIKEAIAALEKLSIPEDDDAAKAAIATIAKELEEKGLKVDHTPMFPRNGRGFIPGVGLAEEVIQAAQSLKPSDPVADEPILSRGKVWAVRVLDHQQKERADFEKEKESFRAEYAKRVRNNLLDGFVSRYEQEHNARMDLEPLQIKYGMLQK